MPNEMAINVSLHSRAVSVQRRHIFQTGIFQTGRVSRANEYKVCSGSCSWHHKQFLVCDMETVEGQKTKVKIFGFIK